MGKGELGTKRENVQDESTVVACDEDNDGGVREVGKKENRQDESTVFLILSFFSTMSRCYTKSNQEEKSRKAHICEGGKW